MPKAFKKGLLTVATVVLGTALLEGCSSGTRASGGLVRLNFQIWDNAQRGGMEVVTRAYMDKNPEARTQAQVISWNECWTKLDAAAGLGQLPDVSWMHADQILRYADYGKLEDVTDLHGDVESDYYTTHFSDISLVDARDSDGRMYGVPKDKDTTCLAYNRKMFDATGVAYPGESWAQDDLKSTSTRIREKTGRYGYMAYADGQLGYWDFIYQAGRYILNEDRIKAGLLGYGTRKVTEFYIGLQEGPQCPDQNYFVETAPGNAFMSEQGAMCLEGNWNLISFMENDKRTIGKQDTTVLPRCPDPVRGDDKVTISSGLCYSTGARGKKLECARDFPKFAGSEGGQRAQGPSGAVIPAYKGPENTWIGAFSQYDYKLDVQKCVNMFPYGVQSVNNASRPKREIQINDLLLEICNDEPSLDQGLEDTQKLADESEAL